MKITVRCFAALKDLVGGESQVLDIDDGSTVEGALQHFEREYPAFQGYRGRIMTAVNLEYVRTTARLRDGDELSLFPPVSGG